jgi:hypothetical protein
LAQQEADEAIDMQKAEIAIEQEIRFGKTGADTVAMWKYLKEGPAWLHGDELVELNTYKAQMVALQEEKEKKALAQADTVEFTSLRVPEYDLIKSGKFGPDIEDFTMPLPPMFPLRAGQSKFALQPVLMEHEKVISKLKVQALPSTLEEVKVSWYAGCCCRTSLLTVHIAV